MTVETSYSFRMAYETSDTSCGLTSLNPEAPIFAEPAVHVHQKKKNHLCARIDIS